ncbi:MAG: hypothetical protein ABSA11_10980 [Candidatus Bathyarchaeia archaeon]
MQFKLPPGQTTIGARALGNGSTEKGNLLDYIKTLEPDEEFAA